MTVPGVRRPRFALRDLILEALAGMLVRPGRTLLTVLGTVLGIAALVATLGLAKTAGNQIATRFDSLAATSVTVENRTDDSAFSRSEQEESHIPWDAEDRIIRLNGVVAAGTQASVNTNDELVRSVPVINPSVRSGHQIEIYAASPGLFDAIGAELATGRLFDIGHERRADPIAVLGPGAARRLGISRVDQQPAVFVGDKTLVVAGILANVQRQPILLDSIVIPNGTAVKLFGLEAPTEVQIRTELGAAQLIGKQAAVALSPNDPALLQVLVPPEPELVKEQVASDVNSLFLVLGGVALAVGAIGIANVTLVSVLERVGEIGLRRAVGATRRHIAAQFLAESAAMGLAGGIIGASIGILIIVAISIRRQWTPVLDLWIPLAAPLVGLATGLTAGIYPSLRAASLQPIEALRSQT